VEKPRGSPDGSLTQFVHASKYLPAMRRAAFRLSEFCGFSAQIAHGMVFVRTSR
jgi:hypothetical protein